ncbi:hypothetical protein RJD38_21140 [Vibrio scophthalmi]|uniref:DUF4760 domain-containing protein n=1 Tax=Vibrio scophthalmi TaxID=45658 RepID=UPI00349F39FE
MRVERLIPLFLMGLVGLCIGVWAGTTGQWYPILTPLVASISVLFATTIALRNLNQSRNHETLKRTLDQLAKTPKVDDKLFDARVKMNEIINELELHKHYDDYPLMKTAMARLDRKSAETIIEIIDYYEKVALCVRLGLYDKDLVSEMISNTYCSVWRDFWPVIRHNQLASENFADSYSESLERPYRNLEREALAQFDGDLDTLITPKGYYRKLHN